MRRQSYGLSLWRLLQYSDLIGSFGLLLQLYGEDILQDIKGRNNRRLL